MLAPALVTRWGRRALYALAVVPAATFAWALTHAGTVREGGAVVETYPWVPQLDQELTFQMTSFPWIMVLLVGGVGALVLAYSAHYFSDEEPGLERFAGVFVAFAGAMFGLVVADDLLLLYVFWELTTVFSYLLIGHSSTKRASRWAAMQALLVTTLGGLAMLVGFIMLGQHAGSYRWSVVVDALPEGPYLAVALVLVLLGALSKSALFPFSFWLPSAMAAPTPVSAYLHAAAMVKAGVFLIGMITPAVAGSLAWQPVVWVCGGIAFLFGGWTALRQTDIKLMVAYGTVSQLGMLSIVLSAGWHAAALAGAALLAAHALFKAALFLVVGIIDKTAGTREIDSLSGVGARRPALLVVSVLAIASMIGLPPTLGFVAKEAMLEAFWESGGWSRAMLVVLVVGSALTVAYGLRFLWGAFARKPGEEDTELAPLGAGFLASAAVLALAGLGAGLFASGFDTLVAPYAAAYPVHESSAYHLALWHGFTPALGLSLLVLTAGALIHLGARRTEAWRSLRLRVSAAGAYRRTLSGLDRTAVELTGGTQRGSLPFYLGVILVTLVVLTGGVLVFGGPWPLRIEPFSSPLQLIIGAVIVVAAISAVIARRRMTAMILTGVSGYGVAALFVLHGAPDLALTQFLVETVTIVMFVLVLRRLPAWFSERPLKHVRRVRIAIGIAVGFVASAMAYVAVNGREAEPISRLFPDAAVDYGGGHNIVNVILVDIRAWDTMGEVAVLVVAATGVASLIFGRDQALLRRGGSRPTPKTGEIPQWISRAAAKNTEPAIILQVITRLIFHVIILFSVYLLFSGHNSPGGGFAGGLVAGLALVVRYLAGGRIELGAAAPVDAGRVLGTGLFISVGTGAAAMLLGGDVLQSALFDFDLPVFGHVHFVTSVFFDIGVYLIVVGLVLDILRSLGAEVDRHGELQSDPNEPVKEAA